MALPVESRSRYLWEAYEFCQSQLGKGRFADAELNRNLDVLRRMMNEASKIIAGRRRDEGAWTDHADKRWPRNHAGADPEHLYDSGIYPPQLLAFPSDQKSWRLALQEKPEAVFDEMIAWAQTPAGREGIGETELQKLLADRETYLPRAAPIRPSASSPEPAAPPAQKEPQGSIRAATEAEEIEARQDGMGWLWDKSADGSLSEWAQSLNLDAVSKFLSGPSSNRRTMDRLLPELMAIEKGGEWARLEEHLASQSPEDASLLVKLRTSLPRSRTPF